MIKIVLLNWDNNFPLRSNNQIFTYFKEIFFKISDMK